MHRAAAGRGAGANRSPLLPLPVDSAGVAKPAKIYDLRSTSISNALANGLTVLETARIAGTSVRMIERHYGALLDTAHESLLERLEGSAG